MGGEAADGIAAPVRVEYFYEPGCAECAMIDAEILPAFETRYRGLAELRAYNLGPDTNYFRLSAYFERLKIEDNEHVYFVVEGREVLAGLPAIRSGLFLAIDREVGRRLTAESGAAPPPAPDAAGGLDLVRKRVAGFTVGGILLAGLADGINPCAFSTMLFLVSVLTLARARPGSLWRAGIAFCVATFLTYTAIGFGLLQALYALAVFPRIRQAADFVLILLLLGLAWLSFRDAIRLRRGGDAADVTLRLPDGLRARIHRLIRERLGRHAPAGTAFAAGVAVTALESMCTGQLYVPALAAVARSGVGADRALALLLAYNVMFVLPLIGVLILAAQGARALRLAEVGRRGTWVGPFVAGIVFLLLALVLAVLAV